MSIEMLGKYYSNIYGFLPYSLSLKKKKSNGKKKSHSQP